ncbi:MAG: flagellar type III secretion system pore protein FliP [Deltaproteobacteria bacterium]|nr:flagellar type III secretion system pore protein FliP [Deltaproteobacteria bacterium]
MLPLVYTLIAVDGPPALSLQVGSGTPGAAAVKIVLLLTVLSLAPAIMLTMTSFLRFTIVFAFLRQALGVQGAPPAQVMTGLALFMTAAAMGPVAGEIHERALSPYLDGKIDERVAMTAASDPLRQFMLRSTREEDLIMFHGAARRPLPRTPAELSLAILVPAYVTSELHTAFRMGLVLLIPFLVIDLVVASVLMSLGMAMLSPMLVSLPLKLLVFLFVDGWSLVVGSLMRGVA